jgi:hypothetical protein
VSSIYLFTILQYFLRNSKNCLIFTLPRQVVRQGEASNSMKKKPSRAILQDNPIGGVANSIQSSRSNSETGGNYQEAAWLKRLVLGS